MLLKVFGTRFFMCATHMLGMSGKVGLNARQEVGSDEPWRAWAFPRGCMLCRKCGDAIEKNEMSLSDGGASAPKEGRAASGRARSIECANSLKGRESVQIKFRFPNVRIVRARSTISARFTCLRWKHRETVGFHGASWYRRFGRRSGWHCLAVQSIRSGLGHRNEWRGWSLAAPGQVRIRLGPDAYVQWPRQVSRPLLTATEIVFSDDFFCVAATAGGSGGGRANTRKVHTGKRENFEVDCHQTGYSAMFLIRPELNAEG
jgi:hypothetical protein